MQKEKAAAAQPDPRDEHATAFYEGPGKWGKQWIMFGGCNDPDWFAIAGNPFGFGVCGANDTNDTWASSGASWTLVQGAGPSSATRPAGRHGHAMAYDREAKKLIMFGGEYLPDGGGPSEEYGTGGYNWYYLNDTWVFDATGWHLAQSGGPPDSARPTPRAGHKMTYDPGLKKVIMFGGWQNLDEPDGSGPQGPVNDTWAFDVKNGSWEKVQDAGGPTAHRPQARFAHGMATPRKPVPPPPDGSYVPPETECTAGTVAPGTCTGGTGSGRGTVDPEPNGTEPILFGGDLGPSAGATNDTWWFDSKNERWDLLQAAGDPGPNRPSTRDYHELAGAEDVLLFGGCEDQGGGCPSGPLNDAPSGYATLNDTWRLSPASGWQKLNTLGAPLSRQKFALGGAPGSALLHGGNCLDDGKPGIFGTGAASAESQGLAMWLNCGFLQSQDTWQLNLGGIGDGTWTQAPPAVSPSQPLPRRGQAMVRLGDIGKGVLFGGCADIYWSQPGCEMVLGDTWLLSGKIWSPASTGLGPTPKPRRLHAMAYDPKLKMVILFGGDASPPGGDSAPLNDTWGFDGKQWELLQEGGPPTAGRPAPRGHHAMAYDELSGQVVLFGGATDGNANGTYDGSTADTWVLDSTAKAWEKLETDESPGARRGHTMAYEPNLGRVLLFGGCAQGMLDSCDESNETWVLDSAAKTWTKLLPKKNADGPPFKPLWDDTGSPPGRFDHAMAVARLSSATNERRLVVFGGIVGDTDDSGAPYGPTREAWMFEPDETAWELVSHEDAASAPTARYQAAMIAAQNEAGGASALPAAYRQKAGGAKRVLTGFLLFGGDVGVGAGAPNPTKGKALNDLWHLRP